MITIVWVKCPKFSHFQVIEEVGRVKGVMFRFVSGFSFLLIPVRLITGV